MWARTTFLAIAAIALPGCILSIGGETVHREVVYVPVPTTSPSANADLEARYRAAMQITVFRDRDAALSRIAVDAADACDVRITRQALASISVFSDRDDAAETAALKLAQRGMRSEAIEIARTITVFSDRDRVLAKLAQ